MRRTWLVPVVILMLVGSACDHDDDEETTVPTPPSSRVSVPTTSDFAVGCPTEYPVRIDVPDDVALLVTACGSRTGTAVRVKNETAGVLLLTATGSHTTWVPVIGPADFVDATVRSVVTGGRDSFGRYSLLPRNAVIASSGTAPRLTVEASAESAVAYAAAHVAGWVQGRLTTPGQRFIESISSCATGLGALLRSQASPWEDTFRDGILRVPACRTVVQTVNGAANEPAIAQSADDIVRQSSRFRGVWDDLARFVGRAATLFPR